MKKLISVICAGLLLASTAFIGCAEPEVPPPPSDDLPQNKNTTSKGWNGFLMNTTAQLAVFDDFEEEENVEKFNNFVAEARDLLEDIESSLSATKSTSYVTKFNNAEAGATVQLDEHAYSVLKIAKSVYEFTEGYYNPAVYYSVQAYGFNGGSSKPPSSVSGLPFSVDIEKYVDLSTHFAELELYEEDGEYFAVKPEYTVEVGGKTLSLKLDLGGVGKGYSADLIDDLFDEYGYTMGHFVFGSSSITCKKYNNGATYNLSGTDPRFDYVNWEADNDDTYFKVKVSDTSLSSSGDYENFFYLDSDGDGVEEVFCHVFNPFTGKPVNTGIMAATIIGGSAAEDDALTTAIMAMGAEKAVQFINEKIPERQVIFAYDGGASGYKYYTNMAAGSYEITDSKYSPLELGK